MSTALPAPVTVVNGAFSMDATHYQFGATIQPYENGGPDMAIHYVLGVLQNGKFIPLPGKRADNGKDAALTLALTDHEWNILSDRAEWKTALGLAAQIFVYIESDRDETKRPAWLPAPV